MPDEPFKVGEDIEFNPFDEPPDTAVEPIDLTELAVAEELAVSGPVDAEVEKMPGIPKDKVPTVIRCQGCGGELIRDGGWRPPANADAAWKHAVECSLKCTATRTDADVPWGFCPRKGLLFVTGEEKPRDYERRKMKPIPWDGVDRRRPASGG